MHCTCLIRHGSWTWQWRWLKLSPLLFTVLCQSRPSALHCFLDSGTDFSWKICGPWMKSLEAQQIFMYCSSKTFFMCEETVIRGSDKRSLLYIYLFVQVWDCVRRRYSHLTSMLLVQVLRGHMISEMHLKPKLLHV